MSKVLITGVAGLTGVRRFRQRGLVALSLDLALGLQDKLLWDSR
jgi:hypothetical protein